MRIIWETSPNDTSAASGWYSRPVDDTTDSWWGWDIPSFCFGHGMPSPDEQLKAKMDRIFAAGRRIPDEFAEIAAPLKLGSPGRMINAKREGITGRYYGSSRRL